jgi:hypothetical protein
MALVPAAPILRHNLAKAAEAVRLTNKRFRLISTVRFADGSRFCYAGPITNRWWGETTCQLWPEWIWVGLRSTIQS